MDPAVDETGISGTMISWRLACSAKLHYKFDYSTHKTPSPSHRSRHWQNSRGVARDHSLILKGNFECFRIQLFRDWDGSALESMWLS